MLNPLLKQIRNVMAQRSAITHLALRARCMHSQRYQRWLSASRALLFIEEALFFTVQALGRIDSQLYERDIRYRQIRVNNDGSDNEWKEINESVALSYLWVLGAYEVIRTLDQRFREGGANSERQRALSTPVKRQFARVRIPLAKLEAPKHQTSTGRSIAHPALTSTHGLGWVLAPGEEVARTELSDLFLSFLEQLRSEQGDHQGT
jgi:hypothetical protein